MFACSSTLALCLLYLVSLLLYLLVPRYHPMTVTLCIVWTVCLQAIHLYCSMTLHICVA